jgi:hypothetical protein
LAEQFLQLAAMWDANLRAEGFIESAKAAYSIDFAEVVPLEQQTPAFHGEYLIAAHNGRVIAKRYVGVDVEAEI